MKDISKIALQFLKGNQTLPFMNDEAQIEAITQAHRTAYLFMSISDDESMTWNHGGTMENCILTKLIKAAKALHGGSNVEIIPAVHDSWRLSYAMEEIGNMKYHKLEYLLHKDQKSANEIAINAYTGKTLQEEYGEE